MKNIKNKLKYLGLLVALATPLLVMRSREAHTTYTIPAQSNWDKTVVYGSDPGERTNLLRQSFNFNWKITPDLRDKPTLISYSPAKAKDSLERALAFSPAAEKGALVSYEFKDAQGNPIWRGTNLVESGVEFGIPPRFLGEGKFTTYCPHNPENPPRSIEFKVQGGPPALHYLGLGKTFKYQNGYD